MLTNSTLSFAEMRVSEIRYRNLFEAAQDGILILDGYTLEITDANPFLTELLGYTRSELIGKQLWEIGLFDDMDASQKIFQDVQLNGYVRYEHLPLQTKDGITREVEFIANLYLEDGDKVIQCHIRDISVRKNLEALARNLTERKKTEARFHRLLYSNIQGVFFWNSNGEISGGNDAFLELTGYTRDDMEAGRINWIAMTPPEYAHRDEKALDQLAATGKCSTYEKDWIRKDGTRVPIMVGAAMFEDDQHDGVCFALDLTEIKRAEAAVRLSEGHFRFLNDLGEVSRTLPDPHHVIEGMTRTLGEHLHASRCVYADVEFASDEISILHDYTDGCLSIVGQYKLSSFGKPAVETLCSGRTLIVRNVDEELSADDGSDMFNAIGVKAVINCPLIKDGILRAIMAVYQAAPRDWTPEEVTIVQEVVQRTWSTIERMRAEIELRESDEKFHQLADNFSDAFWIRSADMRKVYYISPAYEQIWGRTLESDYANPHEWYDFIVPEDRQRVKDTYSGLMRDVPMTDLEYRIIRPDREIRWVRARGFQVKDATGNTIRLTGIITDITERKSLEDQLRHSQKMEAVGVLAGGIAHDFNNILTVINGYCSLTLNKMSADEPLRSNIEEILASGDRAAVLTGQLLAFSRKQVLKPLILNANSIISNLESMLRRVIKENIDLHTILDPALGNINADPGQLEQVILNLVINAGDSMPKGGTLTIETQNVVLDDNYASQHLDITPGAFVKVTVSDTGEGMDGKTQQRIFEPFFTTKELGKGTGLGLSTVYGIVKQSSGDIMVYSEVGHGTTFKIYLPSVDGVVQKPVRTDKTHDEMSGTETILLVEDENIVRALVRTILTGNGYTVLEASNGIEALSVCDTYGETIHLLITDFIMPKMSGIELKDAVTKLLPDIKCLIMSGYTDDGVTDHGMLGANMAFIEKPFTPDGLCRKIREVLRS